MYTVHEEEADLKGGCKGLDSTLHSFEFDSLTGSPPSGWTCAGHPSYPSFPPSTIHQQAWKQNENGEKMKGNEKKVKEKKKRGQPEGFPRSILTRPVWSGHVLRGVPARPNSGQASVIASSTREVVLHSILAASVTLNPSLQEILGITEKVFCLTTCPSTGHASVTVSSTKEVVLNIHCQFDTSVNLHPAMPATLRRHIIRKHKSSVSLNRSSLGQCLRLCWDRDVAIQHNFFFKHCY